MKRHMQMQDTQSHNLLATGSPEPTTKATTDDTVLRNGDEVDARMEQIEQILGHAAMHLLDRYGLVAEWVRHAEAKASVFDQIVPKPKAGRCQSGIARAASESAIPGKTPLGRRKYVERAIKIDSIFEEVKSAARPAGLHNIQCCLLAIAHGHSLEAQIAKVQELAARRSAPRKPRKPTQPGNASGNKPPIQDAGPELTLRWDGTLTAEQEAQLASLRTSWRVHKILRRDEFETASATVQGYFIRDDLVGTTTPEPAAPSHCVSDCARLLAAKPLTGGGDVDEVACPLPQSGEES